MSAVAATRMLLKTESRGAADASEALRDCVGYVMSATATLPTTTDEFYCRAIETLREAGIPFMVAGAYAFGVYTGIKRETKDLDFFLRPADLERTLQHFRDEGYATE